MTEATPKSDVLDYSNTSEVVARYTPFVKSITAKVRRGLPDHIEFDDLIDYGMIGLLEAASRYDADAGAHFMTFAYYRIRGAIYDGLRQMGWLSRSQYKRAKFEAQANDYLEGFIQESPTQDGEDLESSMESLADAVEGLAMVFITSLDAENAEELVDTSTAVDERINLSQTKKILRDAVEKLPEQERMMMELYYFKGLGLQEVGEKLGVSKSWACRLHARVIEKLKRMVIDSLGPD